MESEEELKKRLTKEEYATLRESQTEYPFTGKYVDTKTDGSYHCKVCDAKLFSSDTKFDSGSGWPSFTDPASLEVIDLKPDYSHNMNRTEVVCKNCKSHLGHVFQTGKDKAEYCINSICLTLKEDT